MKSLRYLLLFVSMIITMAVQAQNGQNESLMRSSGRIYVVIAVLVIILAGLILYIIGIDRRLSRLEKENATEKA
jgi:hypothetical protein